MSTYLSLHYHVLFSTRNRVPCLSSKWRNELHAYMGGTVNGLGGFSQIVGGWNDHVHLLFGLKATHVLADVVRELKKASSVWVKGRMGTRNFYWQEGYTALTVGHRQREIVRAYIADQEEHHRVKSYTEEVFLMLEEHGIEYDPKYLK